MKPSRLSVAIVAVCVVLFPAGLKAQAPEQPWGASNGTFRTRLTSNRSAYAIDEPIKLTLEVRNESDTTQPFELPDIIREGALAVRRGGEPVRHIAGEFQTCVGLQPLKPGETRRSEEVRLNEYWDLRQPGRYTVQLPDTKVTMLDVDPFSDNLKQTPLTLPASNVVTVEVNLPLDGKVPPLDLTRRVQLFTRPAGFEVPRWRGIATNVDCAELGDETEDMGAVFAFARPNAAWPVYENQEVHVIVRLPECRGPDGLKVELAELEGSALRLQVRLKEVGDGPRVLPYARLGLDRRLPPGDYTCDVRLLTERKDAAKPEVDGYRFGFAVLAAGPAQ